MTYNAVDFIADQLRAQNSRVDWNISGIDRARELAGIFAGLGVRDLSRLKLAMRSRQTYSADTGLQTEREFYFSNAGVQIGFLNSPALPFEIRHGMLKCAWSAEGHGNVGFFLSPAVGGFIITPAWESSSDLGEVREVAQMLAAVGLSVVMPALGVQVGAELGAAIVGDTFAAAYPGFTAAIGNTALSTAMNGGNIEAAVKSVALGAAGGVAGGAVESFTVSQTGIETLGKVASAATGALIQGGNIDRAVAVSLLQSGAKMGELDNIFSGTVFGQTYDPAIVDWSAGGTYGNTPDNFPVLRDPGFTLSNEPLQSSEILDLAPIDYSKPPAVSLFPVPDLSSPIPVNSEFSATSIINTVSQAALSALGVIRAFKMVNSPAVNQTARAVTPNGSVVVATPDGYVKTRAPNGAVTVAKVPMGQPQSTTDGTLIVNNGDDTFTRISPNGQTQVVRYGNAPSGGSGGSLLPSTVNVGGMNLSPLLLIGGGLGLFLLMKKGR